jgi:hypothetical protein
MSNDTTVSRQWASRPDDQRFLTMEELSAHVHKRQVLSAQKDVALEHITVAAKPDGAMMIVSNNGNKGEAITTNWSFGQVCTMAGAPAGYLRKLPAAVAQIPLAFSLANVDKTDAKLLLERDENGGLWTARAVTSPTYGRIWDADVIDALCMHLDLSVWKVPKSSYAARDPKRATTLYASDRDMFVFLVDDAHPIEHNGEILFRGFYISNSEVGAATFLLCTFLYRTVCDNRIIWGQQDVKELRIRHTSGGPHRFMAEAAPALKGYLEASTAQTVEMINRAQGAKVGDTEAEAIAWLKQRGFAEGLAKDVMVRAAQEPGDPRSMWNVVQGLTSAAQEKTFTDARVELEVKAGKLLDTLF